ncbi:MAG: ABC transporter substrate-binding protein [Frankia sp.]
MPVTRCAHPVARGQALAASVGLVLALVACGSNGSASTTTAASGIPAGDIKLGGILTLSGTAAAFGQFEEAEFQTYADLVNDGGGVRGHKITLDFENDQGDPTVAAQIATKMVSNHIDGIIYPGLPESELQTVPIFNKNKIPVITSDYAGMADAAKYPYLFATYPKPAAQMQALVDGAKARGWSKIAIIQDGTSEGLGLSGPFSSEAKAAGLTITANVIYPATAVDVSTQVAQARSSGADTVAVFATGGYAQVWTAMRSSNWHPHVLTTDIAKLVGYESMKEYAKTAVSTCVEPALTEGESPDADLAAAMKAVEAKLKAPPITFLTAADLFLPVGAFKVAIDQANSVDATALKKVMERWTKQTVVSPLNPLTYSATSHNGRGVEQVKLCGMARQGEFGLNIALPVHGQGS